MPVSQIGILTSMIVYLLGMIVIGILFSRKNESVGDFYLG